MCLGANEPNGPRRCSGHARAAYEKALVEQIEATEKAGEARATHSALMHASVDAAQDRDLARIKLDSAPTQHVDSLAADFDSKAATAARLQQSTINADRTKDELVGKQRLAGAILLNRRAAYESTPEGLARLNLEITQKQRELRDLTKRGEHLTDSANAKTAAVHDMMRRRTEAEARMEDEATERRQNLNFTPFDTELERRRIDEMRRDADAVADEAPEADRQQRDGLRQEIARREAALNAHRRTDASLGGYTGALPGHAEQTADERNELAGVSSIQRPMFSTDGRETVEVKLFREHGDQRISTKVEVPRDAFPEADPFASNSEREPSTVAVIRHLREKRETAAKGHTLSQHVANGGTKDEWYAGVKAARALDALFGRKADDSAE